MKKNLVLFIVFVLANQGYSQVICQTEATQDHWDELSSSMSSVGCFDDLTTFDLTEPITYNLVLSYAKFGTGDGEFEESDLNFVRTHINTVYNPQNIYFNITFKNLDCDECLEHYNNWPEFATAPNCIQGHLVSLSIPTGTAVSGFALGINNGKFWANPTSVPHELGHSIGLTHTHIGQPNYTSELVTRENSTDCTCNCLTTADRICDTPPDPRLVSTDVSPKTEAEIEEWNDDMFSRENCSLDNGAEITDACGTLFTDTDQVVMYNVMSYHCELYDPIEGVLALTAGQNARIRMMTDKGDGTFRYQSQDGEMPLSIEETIDQPTTLNTNKSYNGNLIVNSKLTISSSTIEFTEGHGIILNSGGTLIIDNSILRTYTGGICYSVLNGETFWKGISVQPSNSQSTNLQILASSHVDYSISGIYTEPATSALFNIQVNNSTISGPSVDLKNTSGLNTFLGSNFDNTLKFKDVNYVSVGGCTIDMAQNTESGILAQNTMLSVSTNNGVPTEIKNANKAIEFVSSGIHSLIVNTVEISDCRNGVHAKGLAGMLTVKDCSIELRDPQFISTDDNTGIYIDNFFDVEVHDNEITGTSHNNQVGIDIEGMGENSNPNLYINNSISSCNTGLQSAFADLGNMSGGAEFECNEFNDITNDNFRTSDIGPHQGRGELSINPHAAGNIFDGTTSGYEDFNCESSFWYNKFYHHSDTQGEKPINFNPNLHPNGSATFFVIEITDDPICSYPVVVFNPNDRDQHLPSHEVDNSSPPMFDGGNTGGSIKTIIDDGAHDPNSVITDIVDDSPWVSIDVVHTLFEYGDFFTEQQIGQVILANPGVIVDPYVSEVVFQQGGIDAPTQLAITQAYQVGDDRIDYESGLLDVLVDGSLYIKSGITEEVNSGNYNNDNVIDLLDIKIAKSKEIQIAEHSTIVDVQGYDPFVTKVGVSTLRDPILLDAWANYKEVLEIEQSLKVFSYDWSRIAPSDKSKLIAIANTYHGFATVKARNLLTIYQNGITFGSYPSKPSYPAVSFLEISKRKSSSILADVKVSPNPAKDYIYLSVSEELKELEGILILYNSHGREVLRQKVNSSELKISVNHLSSGIYFYELDIMGIEKIVDKIYITK